MSDDDENIFLFTARQNDDGNLVDVRRTSLKEARRRSLDERERTEARFRSAPFPLYSLPPSWKGPRFLGGGWWGGDHGHERTKALSLVHGTLVHGQGPMLTVETASEFSNGGGALLSVAGMVWSGRSTSVTEAVADLSRDDPNPGIPSAHVARTVLALDVDEVRTSFDAFVDGDEWVARARVGKNFVTVEGSPFDPAGVALVHITDVEPYILGTRRFYERR